MGGCATKPKDADGEAPEVQPAENSVSHESNLVKDEATTDVKAEAVETEKADREKTEEPFVDLSSPKGDAPSSDALAAEEPLKLVSELGELKDNVAPPSPVKAEEVPAPPSVERAALEQEKAPAENKVADRAEEVASSAKESVSAEVKDGKDSKVTKSEVEAVDSLPKDAAVPAVSA